MFSETYQQRCDQLINIGGEVFADINADWQTEASVVLEGSDYVATAFKLAPQLIQNLWQRGEYHRSYSAGDMRARLDVYLDGVANEGELSKQLRLFRREAMVRIIWRDLNRLAELDETLCDLSDMADVCIAAAHDHLNAWMHEQYGVPRDADGVEQKLIVLAMGKLGARELNLSSDIDLIYCFPRHGQTDGRRSQSNEEYFVRLGRKLANVLNKQTVDGFVFRVDLRLRPFGDSGPLVSSYDAMEGYYYSQAREWERYAMVKARALTGDDAEVEHLMGMLRAFVFRRYIDFGAIESIRDMKVMIERELAKKGMDDNVKLGRGGIREIEFIGQAFQLIRGGREPNLQIRPIMKVLEQLAQMELMPRYAVDELTEAYRFLRLTENRIQAWKDQQTHMLFDDDDGKHRLARSMGFEAWEAFALELEKHRSRVQGHFDQVFMAPQADEAEDDSALLRLWQADEYGEEQVALLSSEGFAKATESIKALQEFKDSSRLRRVSTRGQGRLDRLMPMLFRAVLNTQDPDATFQRILKLIEAVAGRTAYLDLLVENPLALSQLVRLAGESVWVVSQLIRQPILLDELLDSRSLYSPLKQEDLAAELRGLMVRVEDDLEQEMELLRQFARSNRLKVAAADIAAVIPLMVVSDYLTAIAEVVLDRVQQTAWNNMGEKHGHPTKLETDGSGFAIIGYGKMGGIELGYGSDLDLVFLHGSLNANACTDGKKEIANDVFYARLGQRIIHMLTAHMPSGILYETDMRLRPNGNSGMLVSSLVAFEKYQQDEAWTWEHQALVRARAVAGDPGVIAHFDAIRKEILCQKRDLDKLRADVLEMREKMRDNLDKSTDEIFHIKQGAGGLVDIEFIVQYAVLRWANEYPGLTRWSDNMRLLDTLAELSLLEGRSAELLQNAYCVFRAVTHRKALQEDSSVIPVDQLAEERQMVRDIWQQVFEIS